MRDDFTAATLAPYWTFIRTPRESIYDLTSTPGSLTLKARPAQLGTRTQLSFVGRRQQHINASASTAMRYAPAKPGDVAGLVAFQTDDFCYLLGVTLVDGKPAVQVVERDGATSGGRRCWRRLRLSVAPNAPVYLKIVARWRQI